MKSSFSSRKGKETKIHNSLSLRPVEKKILFFSPMKRETNLELIFFTPSSNSLDATEKRQEFSTVVKERRGLPH